MQFRLPSSVIVGIKAKKASRRGKSSKAKGARFEKFIAQTIADRLQLPLSDVFRTRTGPNQEDIGLSREAASRFPFSVEAKHHRTLHLPEWLRQAEENAAKVGRHPVVVFRISHELPGQPSHDYVVIDFSTFLDLAIGANDG